MICFWVRLKRALERETGTETAFKLLSLRIEDEGGRRAGEAVEEDEENNSRIGDRRRASDII